MRLVDPLRVDDSFRRIDVRPMASLHGWIGSMPIGLPCCWCRYCWDDEGVVCRLGYRVRCLCSNVNVVLVTK